MNAQSNAHPPSRARLREGKASTNIPQFSAAWSDAFVARSDQLALGHDTAADDATGPLRILDHARRRIGQAHDMLMGDPHARPARMSANERTVLRRRLVIAMALIAATIDTLDRVPVAAPGPAA